MSRWCQARLMTDDDALETEQALLQACEMIVAARMETAAIAADQDRAFAIAALCRWEMNVLLDAERDGALTTHLPLDG